MKRLIPLLLVLSLCFSGCKVITPQPELKQFNATFLDLFDTLTTIVGRAESSEVFQSQAQQIHDDLLIYHRLFDIYHEYEGMVNLKTLNDTAALAPVTVDPKILALLQDCKALYQSTGGKVNVAMGTVLSLWHEARTDGVNDPVHAYLPRSAELEDAALHCDLENVILNEEDCTVYFADPLLKLDVGAIAKGWSVQRVAENVPSGLLLSVGGNVCATGPKDAQGTPWVIGIEDPQGGESYVHTLYLSKGCVVTSGDYQRAYVVDGQLYHHIIDPETLQPSTYWRSVSVVCEDSGIADALSTALFLLPLEDGQALLTQYEAEALWINAQGEKSYSPGFQALIRT
ncbi:MAG: FAD:protein FMN transferase [Oscillospiraceae bacterium]|nr:FAD:protein FMN transferase [Oscillospiraceae bacterium]